MTEEDTSSTETQVATTKEETFLTETYENLPDEFWLAFAEAKQNFLDSLPKEYCLTKNSGNFLNQHGYKMELKLQSLDNHDKYFNQIKSTLKKINKNIYKCKFRFTAENISYIANGTAITITISKSLLLKSCLNNVFQHEIEKAKKSQIQIRNSTYTLDLNNPSGFKLDLNNVPSDFDEEEGNEEKTAPAPISISSSMQNFGIFNNKTTEGKQDKSQEVPSNMTP